MTADELLELDGVSWCVTHDDLWHEGDTDCRRRWLEGNFAECVEVPLFRALAPGEQP